MFTVPVQIPKATSSPAVWDEFAITDFSGGLCTAFPSAHIRDNQFQELSNFLIQNDTSLIVREPFAPLDADASKESIFPDSAAPTSFAWVTLGTTDYLVGSWDNGSYMEVSYWDQANNRWAGEGGGTTINATLQDGYRVTFDTFSVNDQEDLLFANGYDLPQRWTGSGASTSLGLTVPWNIANEGDGDVTLDNAAAVDAGSGVVTIPATAHGFSANDVITLSGTTNYDGTYKIVAVATNTFNITATFVAETFAGTELAKSPTITAGDADDVEDDPGLMVTGTFYYKLAYFYESSSSTKYGESGPQTTEMSVDVADAADNHAVWVTFTNLPLIADVDSDISKILIYRSPPDISDGPYRLVGETTTATFVDRTPYGSEGAEALVDDGTPPRLKNITVFKGRVWGIGLASDGSLTKKFAYSEDGQPDIFLASSCFYMPDEAVGAVPFNNNLYLFTRKQIYVIPQGDVATYSTPLKLCEKGATSFESIVDVGNGLMWQGEDNVYWADFNTQALDGDFPIPVGDPIKNQIKGRNTGIAAASRSKSNACYHDGHYYLSICQSGSVCTTTLAMNVEISTLLMKQGSYGGWSQMDWAANDMQSFKGTLYTADNTNCYIMEHGVSGSVDYLNYTNYAASSGSTLSTTIKSKILHFGHEWAEKIVNSISLATETSGATFNALLSFNGDEFTRNASLTLGSASVATAVSWLYWSVGTWNDYYWAGDPAGFVAKHVKFKNQGKGRYVELTLSSSNSCDTRIMLLKLYHRLLPPPA